eukprot:TRINITY_DN66243_c2_g1_i1.p1 TRINITY_DN66243_c2_g1~~TRINITY_DN66243_c2_g1_i1.p1  ORF type:complete len:608 (+),score=64.72 TRINITY_DN66243_c2_g1_i1:48-1871(+)
MLEVSDEHQRTGWKIITASAILATVGGILWWRRRGKQQATPRHQQSVKPKNRWADDRLGVSLCLPTADFDVVATRSYPTATFVFQLANSATLMLHVEELEDSRTTKEYCDITLNQLKEMQHQDMLDIQQADTNRNSLQCAEVRWKTTKKNHWCLFHLRGMLAFTLKYSYTSTHPTAEPTWWKRDPHLSVIEDIAASLSIVDPKLGNSHITYSSPRYGFSMSLPPSYFQVELSSSPNQYIADAATELLLHSNQTNSYFGLSIHESKKREAVTVLTSPNSSSSGGGSNSGVSLADTKRIVVDENNRQWQYVECYLQHHQHYFLLSCWVSITTDTSNQLQQHERSEVAVSPTTTTTTTTTSTTTTATTATRSRQTPHNNSNVDFGLIVQLMQKCIQSIRFDTFIHQEPSMWYWNLDASFFFQLTGLVSHQDRLYIHLIEPCIQDPILQIVFKTRNEPMDGGALLDLSGQSYVMIDECGAKQTLTNFRLAGCCIKIQMMDAPPGGYTLSTVANDFSNELSETGCVIEKNAELHLKSKSYGDVGAVYLVYTRDQCYTKNAHGDDIPTTQKVKTVISVYANKQYVLELVCGVDEFEECATLFENLLHSFHFLP